MLYPLKFKPIFKERIWGGRKIETVFGKKLPAEGKIGESWELSGVEGDVSVVANGSLKGNNLQELIEIYMGDLVGERVFEQFGEEFPLLIKLIDADDNLSIQVHPDDKLAAERHHSFGKTEMWYVVGHEPDAKLYLGFNQPVDKAKYLEYLEAGKLADLLNAYKVEDGDSYFIPSKTIHAIGKGLLIAEIQQTSDITYRVFDWNRVDPKTGKGRELHTELALDAIDYKARSDYKTVAVPQRNAPVTLEKCPYFQTNSLVVDGTAVRDYAPLDSFVIYICLDGELTLTCESGSESLKKGETVLIPAEMNEVTLSGRGKVLEVYIPEEGK